MGLEKPTIQILGKDETSAFYEHSYEYEDPNLPGMTQIIKVGMLTGGESQVETSNIDGSIERAVGYYYRPEDVPHSAIQGFVFFKRLLNNCVNNGEEIYQAFLSNELRICKGDKTKEVVVYKKDFMRLKDDLMQEVKRNYKLKGLANKEFRRSLDNFITYRNIFTHGELCLIISIDGVIEENDFALRYVDKSTQRTVVMRINKGQVESYLETYRQIRLFIQNYNELKS